MPGFPAAPEEIKISYPHSSGLEAVEIVRPTVEYDVVAPNNPNSLQSGLAGVFSAGQINDSAMKKRLRIIAGMADYFKGGTFHLSA